MSLMKEMIDICIVCICFSIGSSKGRLGTLRITEFWSLSIVRYSEN
jgi:hypothetical protein